MKTVQDFQTTSTTLSQSQQKTTVEGSKMAKKKKTIVSTEIEFEGWFENEINTQTCF